MICFTFTHLKLLTRLVFPSNVLMAFRTIVGRILLFLQHFELFFELLLISYSFLLYFSLQMYQLVSFPLNFVEFLFINTIVSFFLISLLIYQSLQFFNLTLLFFLQLQCFRSNSFLFVSNVGNCIQLLFFHFSFYSSLFFR